MLNSIHLVGVGPSPELKIDFAPRLNFLTGDNGLGKTFFLDMAWFVLTRSWARGMMAVPQPDVDSAQIKYSYTASRTEDSGGVAEFRRNEYRWRLNFGVPHPFPGIVIYAGLNGSFSTWDPARNSWEDDASALPKRPGPFNLSSDQVWQGASGPNEIRYCNGLIHDWVSWQKGGEASFKQLSQVLDKLSPSPGEPLLPGKPSHIGPIDETEYPTLRMPYGQEVPLIHASGAIRRIAALAYLLVWTWNGHQRAAREMRLPPAQEIVFLIDEVECHLHPQWQRRIVPALLKVTDALAAGSKIPVQIIAATHSPLVLASIEPDFDEDQDAVFTIALDERKSVTVDKQAWSKQGDVTNWLVSDTFGLQQARSVDAERAIEAAEAWMRGDHAALPENLNTQDLINTELERVLAGHDDFWPRWVVWTERVRDEKRLLDRNPIRKIRHVTFEDE